MVPIVVGFFLLACAVLASVRGTIFNNIWWVVVVTSLSTALGLGRRRAGRPVQGREVAKSLIFLPMAISFVGAGIIWRFMYIARGPGDTQTGVINAIWVWLGEISNSTGSKIIAVCVSSASCRSPSRGLIARAVERQARRRRPASAIGFLLLVLFFIYRFLGPGLGGFVEATRTARRHRRRSCSCRRRRSTTCG